MNYLFGTCTCHALFHELKFNDIVCKDIRLLTFAFKDLFVLYRDKENLGRCFPLLRRESTAITVVHEMVLVYHCCASSWAVPMKLCQQFLKQML